MNAVFKFWSACIIGRAAYLAPPPHAIRVKKTTLSFHLSLKKLFERKKEKRFTLTIEILPSFLFLLKDTAYFCKSLQYIFNKFRDFNVKFLRDYHIHSLKRIIAKPFLCNLSDIPVQKAFIRIS